MNSKISSTITIFVICMSLSDIIMAQRPSFAGPRPQSGYKDRFRPPTEAPTQEISNRFGEDLNRPQVPPSSFVDVVKPALEFVPINNPINQNTDLTNRFSSDSEITERLPYDALGDKELVKYYNSLPEDQRPFWLINAKAIEAHRNRSAGSVNTNVLAERGSFAGPGIVSNNRVIQEQQRQRFPQNQQQSQQEQRFPQNQQQSQQEQIQQDIQQDQRQIQLLQLQLQQQRQLDQQQQLQRQIQEIQQRLQQRQSSNGLSNRADFGSPNIGSNFVSNVRPSQNKISNSVNVPNGEVDSKGGRFVYIDANLYKILKQNNLVV